MAQSATPATQHPTSRHNGGTASQLRKRVRVTDEEDFRVTDEGLSLKGGPCDHPSAVFGAETRRIFLDLQADQLRYHHNNPNEISFL